MQTFDKLVAEQALAVSEKKPTQAQYSLTQQLAELAAIANEKGLYDAADFVQRAATSPSEYQPRPRPPKPPWSEPASDEEANTRRQTLITDIQGIEAQLGNRNRELDGQRMQSNEWYAWRNRAIAARKHKLEDLRLTNEWIKSHHRKRAVEHFDDSTAALAAASKLLHTLAAEDVEFEPEEQAIVDGIDAILGYR
jgi:hypothetical protein